MIKTYSHDHQISSGQVLDCKLIINECIGREIFRLHFLWPGPAPKAGQFFMIKPFRSSVYLGRPVSVAHYNQTINNLQFLIARRGRGTSDIVKMYPGEYAQLMGPLGNAWTDFIKPVPKDMHTGEKPIALAGGGIGIAPLEALYSEFSNHHIDFYAGFKTAFTDTSDKSVDCPLAVGHKLSQKEKNRIIVATEDGSEGKKGLITDFLDIQKYSCICACGPQPMLKKIADDCKAAGVPCFVSLERYMACGAGACLGCTVTTRNENRRCCADGPIFPAEDLIFDE